MLAVVDANIVFSSLISKGKPFEVFEANRVFKAYEFVAPEFLFIEIDSRMDKIASQTRLSKAELEEVFSFIKSQMTIISFVEFSDFFPKAKELNFKDSPYLALAMKLNCPIISGDKKLKRVGEVEVLSPSEALIRIYGI